MILLSEVMVIHDESIKLFGGSYGVRDKDGLESAINRPFQSFGGEELYPHVILKAAALIESIVANHPFVDGNKRTGFMVAGMFLSVYGYSFMSNEDDNYAFVIAIASGEMHFDEIVIWLKNNTAKN